MMCKKCGVAMGPSAVYCSRCGEKHIGRERAAKRAESERFIHEMTPWADRLSNFLQDQWQKLTGLSTPRSRKLDHIVQQFREASEFVVSLSRNPRKGLRSSFSLDVGEIAFLEEPCVFKEVRRTWQTDGDFVGFGDRVFGGVSQSETREINQVQPVDSGLLCLTDRRLLFRGQTAVRTTILKNIISAENGLHGLAVAAHGEKTQQLYGVENPHKWESAIREVKKGT